MRRHVLATASFTPTPCPFSFPAPSAPTPMRRHVLRHWLAIGGPEDPLTLAAVNDLVCLLTDQVWKCGRCGGVVGWCGASSVRPRSHEKDGARASRAAKHLRRYLPTLLPVFGHPRSTHRTHYLHSLPSPLEGRSLLRRAHQLLRGAEARWLPPRLSPIHTSTHPH
eukprot:101577-Chlamydomonas_euryale.AAC.1